jgi:hypothetical protein
VPTIGVLDITVDWTFASNDINFSLFQGTLTEIEAACSGGTACPQEVAIVATSAKPETLTFANAAAGAYLLQIVNFGSTPESGTYEIRLTSTAAASQSTLGASTTPGAGLGSALGWSPSAGE